VLQLVNARHKRRDDHGSIVSRVLAKEIRELHISALRGKEPVWQRFPTPRLLRDRLALFNRPLATDQAGVELSPIAAGQ
jgi:hypothetical protein